MEMKKRIIILATITVFLLLCVYWVFFPNDRLIILVLLFFYCLLVFFTIFIKYSVQFSGGFLSNRINGMIYAKRYLKEKPVMLARIVGLIQQHDFATAEQELLAILQSKPGALDVVIMLGQLYLDNLRNYAAAEQTTAAYLLYRNKVAPEDLKVVNLYVDACLEQGKKTEALARLDYELKQRGYDRTDIIAMQTRREALSK